MHRPIGIFDSGVGGLSIAKAILQRLPSEDLLYIADHKFSPYGEQPKSVISERCNSIVRHFVEQNCKAVIVACNTATVNMIHMLRQHHDIPLIGVEPGIKPAAENSKTGTIGILATHQTLSSDAFKKLSLHFSDQVIIEQQACPDFVKLVESNNLSSKETKATAKKYIEPLLNKGADQIVLGCTHYSFLSEAIHQVIRERAAIIDTAQAVAREVERRLKQHSILQSESRQGNIRIWSTDHDNDTASCISKLMGYRIPVLPATNLK